MSSNAVGRAIREGYKRSVVPAVSRDEPSFRFEGVRVIWIIPGVALEDVWRDVDLSIFRDYTNVDGVSETLVAEAKLIANRPAMILLP